jgi:hypothetical protein
MVRVLLYFTLKNQKNQRHLYQGRRSTKKEQLQGILSGERRVWNGCRDFYLKRGRGKEREG